MIVLATNVVIKIINCSCLFQTSLSHKWYPSFVFTDGVPVEVNMELVKCKPQGEKNHRQTQETVRGGSLKSLACTREDSGNGSQSDEECQLNGDIATQHLCSENEPSADEETKKVQNTSSGRSVECNGVEQEIVSDKCSLSNGFDSSCGLKHPAKKLERQDPVNPLLQDHLGNFLQTPAVICSYKNSCSEKQGGNFNTHSTDTFESPKEGKQSHENTSERNQDIKINQSHLAVEERDSDNIKKLPHQSQSSTSSSELQNKTHEGSETSAAGLHQDNIPSCLYVPCSPENMFPHPKEFMSLSVSPSDLVPKHIMNSLARELIRERWKANMLQVENKRLSMVSAMFQSAAYS